MGFPRSRFLCLTGILFTALRLTGAEADPAWHTFHHEHVLGTSRELRFAAAKTGDAQRAEAAALAEIDRLAAILSGYDTNSEFSRWAATQGEPRRVSSDLINVLSLFDQWRERTRGALDAAAETAVRLWRGAAEQGRVPSSDEIAAAVAAVAARHWELNLDAGTATRLSAAPLRLNSFAKGSIIDRAAAAALASAPIAGAVINLGGDVLVRGPQAVTVAVTDPLADAET
ncbi:MAG: FAD:protein FMN transferase, partial [Opitutaceae bacterium]